MSSEARPLRVRQPTNFLLVESTAWYPAYQYGSPKRSKTPKRKRYTKSLSPTKTKNKGTLTPTRGKQQTKRRRSSLSRSSQNRESGDETPSRSSQRKSGYVGRRIPIESPLRTPIRSRRVGRRLAETDQGEEALAVSLPPASSRIAKIVVCHDPQHRHGEEGNDASQEGIEKASFCTTENYSFLNLLKDAATHWNENLEAVELQDDEGCVMPLSVVITQEELQSFMSNRNIFLVRKSRSEQDQRSSQGDICDHQNAEDSERLETKQLMQNSIGPMNGNHEESTSSSQREKGKEKELHEIVEDATPAANLLALTHKRYGIHVLREGAVQTVQNTVSLQLRGRRIVRVSTNNGYTEQGEVYRCVLKDDKVNWIPELLPPDMQGGIIHCVSTEKDVFALHASGELRTWPRDSQDYFFGSMGRPLRECKVKDVSCGKKFVVAITEDGRAYSWGEGSSGELGLGRSVQMRQMPTLLESVQDKPIEAVSAGDNHTLLLTRQGGILSFGVGSEGRLGTGSCNNEWLPTPVNIPAPQKTERDDDYDDDDAVGQFLRVYAGACHSAAVNNRGRLYTWGNGKYGQLGHCNQENKLRPALVENLKCENVIQVTCEALFTAALTVDGLVYTFGFRMTPNNYPREYSSTVMCSAPHRSLKGICNIACVPEAGLLIAIAGELGGTSGFPISLE